MVVKFSVHLNRHVFVMAIYAVNAWISICNIALHVISSGFPLYVIYIIHSIQTYSDNDGPDPPVQMTSVPT